MSERKYFDVYGASTTALTGGNNCWDTANGYLQPSGIAGPNLPSCGWLTGLSQALGSSSRAYNTIKATQLNCRLNIVPDINFGTFGFLRILVVVDNQCDGVYPDIDDLFASPAGRNETFLEPAYFGRFRVLKDHHQYFTCGTYWNGTTAVDQLVTSDQSCIHEWNFDLKDHEIKWDTTGSSAIANARNGHIFVFATWAKRTISAGVISEAYTNPPQFQLTTRLRFSDVPN